ncbi:MAG: hypothetical protein R2731_05930 [Nocardioides sp.]
MSTTTGTAGVAKVVAVPDLDLVLSGTASFDFHRGGYPFGAVDVEVSRSSARADAMAPYLSGASGLDPDQPFRQPIAAGEVLCIRYREAGTADAWLTQCQVRGWGEEAFITAGDVTRVTRTGLGDGDGVALAGRGRLLVPDLMPGMRVAVVTGRTPNWQFSGSPRWRSPDGREPATSAYSEPDEPALLYRVTGSGTGRVVADTRTPTAPVGVVAVYPAWYQFRDDLFPTHWTGTPWLPDPVFEAAPAFAPGGTALARVSDDVSEGWTLQYQLRRGDSRRAKPAWVTHELTGHTTAVRVRLKPGQAACVRYRPVSPTGDPKAWSSQACTARPYDDTAGRVTGASRRVAEPYFADGRATVLSPRVTLRLPRLRPRGTVGVVFLVRPGASYAKVDLLMNGRQVTWWGPDARPGWPSVRWVRTGGGGTFGVRPRDTAPERIAGLLVVPRWAMGGYDF